MMNYILFSLILLMSGCGHAVNTLQGTDTTDTPPVLEIAAPSIGQPTGEKVDWDTSRQETANHPLPPERLPPPAEEAVLVETDPPTPMDAYIQGFERFLPGDGAGFGQADILFWISGPPFGGGNFQQSVDVVSLGNEGVITLRFPNYFPINGEGPDFIVFENAFYPRGSDEIFAEPAEVEVSQNGFDFFKFPCRRDPPYIGCAGTKPVYANPDFNDLNPRNPREAGGNAFDLEDVGLDYARYIRIRDLGLRLGGEVATRTGQAGFDLDAVAIVHGTRP